MRNLEGNMRLQKSLQVLVLSGVLCSPAFCSEEDIRAPHKISLWANAGRPFGNVGATIERTDPGSTYPYKPIRIKSIVLIVGQKKYVVPQASFKNLQYPLIHTTEFRTIGARDGGSPWLCLVFLAKLNSKPGADSARIYIRFRDEQLQTTLIRTAK